MSELLEDLIECNEKIELLEAELADLRASSVVVRKKCERCKGSGIGYQHLAYYDGPSEPCPDCVDGWQLAEGVQRAANGWWVIPHLIEGEE